MSNIIKTDLPGGYVSLVPAEGFHLVSLRLGRPVSEAVVKASQVGEFAAVADE